jgi:hypothetical protein
MIAPVLALLLSFGEGRIVGTIDHPEKVASISALDRDAARSVAGTIDRATGKFAVAGLAPGTRYDLRIEMNAGARLEGVDLAVPRSDFEEEQPLAADEAKKVGAAARALQTFEDRVDVLSVSGNVQHAAVVLNKVRTKPFINSKPGEVVWRAEVWRFEKPHETWIKTQDRLFTVLYRERIPAEEYAAKSITLDPAIGGLEPTAKTPEVDAGQVALPEEKPGVRFRSNAGVR